MNRASQTQDFKCKTSTWHNSYIMTKLSKLSRQTFTVSSSKYVAARAPALWVVTECARKHLSDKDCQTLDIKETFHSWKTVFGETLQHLLTWYQGREVKTLGLNNILMINRNPLKICFAPWNLFLCKAPLSGARLCWMCMCRGSWEFKKKQLNLPQKTAVSSELSEIFKICVKQHKLWSKTWCWKVIIYIYEKNTITAEFSLPATVWWRACK